MSSKLLAKALEASIDDPRLKLLLIGLADSANDAGLTEPRSVEWLMQIVGRKRTSIFHYINQAEAALLLKRLPQFDRNQQAENKYQLFAENWPSGTTDAVQHAERRRPSGTVDAVQHAEPPAVQHVERHAVQHAEPPPFNHARTPLIHGLDGLDGLNPGEQISTAQSHANGHNAKKAYAFEPAPHLIEWASLNCALVPLQTTTQAWRKFVSAQPEKLKNAAASWRSYFKKAQAWREQEATERAGLYVGGNYNNGNGNGNGHSNGHQDRTGQGSLNGAARADAAQPSGEGKPAFAPHTPKTDWAAVYEALTGTEQAALRARVEVELRAKVGDRFDYLWEPETRENTIKANVLKLLAEEHTR